MAKPQQVVTLISLHEGAACELWQAELSRVLENLADRNTALKSVTVLA